MSSKPGRQAQNALRCTACGKSFRNQRILTAHLVHTHQLKAPEPEPHSQVEPETQTRIKHSKMICRVYCGPGEKGKTDGRVSKPRPKLYQCPKCSTTFSQYQKMARHFAIKHNIDEIRDQIRRIHSLPIADPRDKEKKFNNGHTQLKGTPDASDQPVVKHSPLQKSKAAIVAEGSLHKYEAVVNNHSKLNKLQKSSIETISMLAPEVASQPVAENTTSTVEQCNTRVTCSCTREYPSWENFERHIPAHHDASSHSFFFPQLKYFHLWKAEMCKATGLIYAIKPNESSRYGCTRQKTVWHCLHGTLTRVVRWCPSAIFVHRFDAGLQVTLYIEHPGFKGPPPYAVPEKYQPYHLQDFSGLLFQSWDRTDEKWALEALSAHIRGITNRAVEKLAGLDASHLTTFYCKLLEILATINDQTHPLFDTSDNNETPSAGRPINNMIGQQVFYSEDIRTPKFEEVYVDPLDDDESTKVVDTIVWEMPETILDTIKEEDCPLKLSKPFTLIEKPIGEVDIEEELLTVAVKPKQNGKASLELAKDSPKGPSSSYADTFKDFLVKGAGPPLLGSVIKGGRAGRNENKPFDVLEDDVRKYNALRKRKVYRPAPGLLSRAQIVPPEPESFIKRPTSTEGATKITLITEASVNTTKLSNPIPSNYRVYTHVQPSPSVDPKVTNSPSSIEIESNRIENATNRPSRIEAHFENATDRDLTTADIIAKASRPRGRPRSIRRSSSPPARIEGPGLKSKVSNANTSVATITAKPRGRPRSKRRSLTPPARIEGPGLKSKVSNANTSVATMIAKPRGRPRSKRRRLRTPAPLESPKLKPADSEETESILPELKSELEDTMPDVASEPETLISDVKSEPDMDDMTIEETVVGRLENYEVMEQENDCNILIFKI